MGTNNKARRATQRRRQQARTSGTSRGQSNIADWPIETPVDDAERAARLLSEAVTMVLFRPASASEQAVRLMREVPDRRLVSMLHRLLTDLTTRLVASGWTPNDLGEITPKRLSVRHLSFVATLVTEETRTHPASTVSPAWHAELASLGPPEPIDLSEVSGVTQALELMCLFRELPPLAQSMPPPGSPPDAARGGTKDEHRMLAKVRALLAKAEATEFPEESEALSAKAQQLISAHSLDHLASQVDTGAAEQPLGVRRIWLDAPYVPAKSMLVHVVASANHCSSVFIQQLGVVTLVGRPTDADATELLVTSLLLQADRAMLLNRGEGSRSRASRTPSFRRSFLVSYASRIGERLQETAADALATSSRSGELVPVLARVDEQVRAATEQLFPQLVEREVRISNAMGWAAGRAAADLAVFNVRDEISEEAAS